MSFKALSSLLLLTILAVPSTVWGSGWEYEDAHNGFHDNLRVNLLDYYYRLYYPNETLEQRIERGRALSIAGGELEVRQDRVGALSRYREALIALNGFSKDYDVINRAQDRVDLLASLTAGDDFSLATAYTDARDNGDITTLSRIAETTSIIADNATYALASIAYRKKRYQDALAQLTTLNTKFPGSEKRDAATFLDARIRLAMAMDNDAPPSFANLQASFNAYLANFPNGTYRAESLGWLAYLDLHQAKADGRELDPFNVEKGELWPAKEQESLALVQRYLAIIDDPRNHTMFITAVESLRFGYRRIRQHPPEQVLANPQHACAFLYHALTDVWKSSDERQRFLQGILPQITKGLPDVAARTLPPEVLIALGEAYFLASDASTAQTLARASANIRPSAMATYLLARCAIANDNLDDAFREYENLIQAGKDNQQIAELGLHLGGAFERAKRPGDALACYGRSGSILDIRILIDGEMDTEDLRTFVSTHTELKPLGYMGKWMDTTIPDYMPIIREYLGVRLVRDRHFQEALGYLEGDRRAALQELMRLQADVDAAAPDQRPSRLYFLAAFWYHRGRACVFVNQSWHQFTFSGMGWKDFQPSPSQTANMEAMTTYIPARDLFLHIANTYPNSPEAPKALYSAACCFYWLCGQNYLSHAPYWRDRSKREGFWKQGDELIQRLHQKYPEHPLASSEWAKKVGK